MFRVPGPSFILLTRATLVEKDWPMKWSLCLKEPPWVSSVHTSGRRSCPILGVLGSWQRSCLLSFLPFYPRFIIYTREIKNSPQLVLRSSLFPIFHNPHQENEVFQECLWDHEQMLVHSLIPQLLHTRSLPWTLPLSEAVVFPSLHSFRVYWAGSHGRGDLSPRDSGCHD